MFAPLIQTLSILIPHQQSVERVDTAWNRGALEIGGLIGYGHESKDDPQRPLSSLIQLTGRVAIHFGGIGSAWRRGNFAIVAEGVVIYCKLGTDIAYLWFNVIGCVVTKRIFGNGDNHYLQNRY